MKLIRNMYTFKITTASPRGQGVNVSYACIWDRCNDAAQWPNHSDHGRQNTGNHCRTCKREFHEIIAIWSQKCMALITPLQKMKTEIPVNNVPINQCRIQRWQFYNLCRISCWYFFNKLFKNQCRIQRWQFYNLCRISCWYFFNKLFKHERGNLTGGGIGGWGGYGGHLFPTKLQTSNGSWCQGIKGKCPAQYMWQCYGIFYRTVKLYQLHMYLKAAICHINMAKSHLIS